MSIHEPERGNFYGHLGGGLVVLFAIATMLILVVRLVIVLFEHGSLDLIPSM